MRHRLLRSISLAVVFGLLVALLPSGAHADALDDLEAQIQRYETQLARINAQQTSVRDQIAVTQDKLGRLRAVLVQLNSQLLENNARLSQNQARLDDLVRREDILSTQLQETQRRMEERQAAFASQVRVLDKVENRSAFSLLLTSHSFVQFVQRLTGIKQVADGTKQLADQLRSDRDLLAIQRAELDRARAEQVKVVATIEQQRQVLQQEYAIQSTATLQLLYLQARLGQQQSELTNQASGVESQIASDESQIQSLLAFSHGAGGNIVAPEYLSDSWGKYYNQRDARWGNVYLGR